MPIYEYACSACGRKTDILHGIHDPIPAFCPECGAEGTLRKSIAAPAIVFKGSGWAKKDRGSGARTKAAAKEEGSPESKAAATSDAAKGPSSTTPSTPTAPGPAAPPASPPSGPGAD